MDGFDDIYRFLTEKTYPKEMGKSEKRNFRLKVHGYIHVMRLQYMVYVRVDVVRCIHAYGDVAKRPPQYPL